MIEFAQSFLYSLFWFLVVLTVVVFVHEFGHFWVARRCGVRVEVFSIGFGREIWSRESRSGTRWRIALLPMGGFVKFFGDTGPTSSPGGMLPRMTEDEKAVSFHHKTIGQRSAIVAAGPIANFILSILILTVLYASAGRPFTPPAVEAVNPDSAAAEAGFQPGDLIVAIDGQDIDRFESIREIVMVSAGKELTIQVERAQAMVTLKATPRTTEIEDRLGNVHKIGMLGLGGAKRQFVRLGPIAAVAAGFADTYRLVAATLHAVGEMILGMRSGSELGGPIMIAQMSGAQAAEGWLPLLEFVVVLSASLGLINLFPIPALDGGHLAFYSIEAVRGKPLGPRAQEYGTIIGLAMVVSLMLFATFNDLSRPAMLDFFTKLIG